MESKFCNICNRSVPQHESAWVRPCLCPEVHRHCLLAVVRRVEVRACIVEGILRCRLCGVHLSTVPDKGPLVRILEAIDRKWYPRFCEVAMKVFTVVLVDVTSASLGLMVLHDVCGNTAAKYMILGMDPVFGINFCQAIIYTCVLLNSLHWEEALLYILRRCSNIPIIGRILPLEDNNVKVPADKRTSTLDYITGGIFLPTFAYITGNLVFFTEPSREKRFILGGAMFILLKGFLKAYYKQKNYVRESCLTLSNYSEHT